VIVSCSIKGPLSGKRSFKRTERELAGPGRPGKVDRLRAKVERREAQRLAEGRARLALSAARGGYVIPASKDASQASWRLPPLHPLAQFAEGLAKLGRSSAARMQKLGCLKIESAE